MSICFCVLIQLFVLTFFCYSDILWIKTRRR
nr:MAG TPA: Endothelin family protein [Caudoviricetes sp.]